MSHTQRFGFIAVGFLTAALLVGGVNTAFAVGAFPYATGGTGTTTPNPGQLVWWGKTFQTGIATTSVTCSGAVSCAAFTAIGASPITIAASIAGSVIPVSTSSAETATYVPFWTTTGATPALLSGGNSTFNFVTASNRLNFTYGSTTAITAQFFCLTGDTCKSTWPTGTVSSVGTGTGLTGGPITTSGTISIPTIVGTSSSETAANVPFYTSTNGTPALVSGGNTSFNFVTAANRLNFTYSSSTGLSSTGGAYFALSGGAVSVGTISPTDMNSNAKLTVAGNGFQVIVASTSDNTASSAAILETYAAGVKAYFGAHASGQSTVRFGLSLGGWAELAATSTAGTSNGMVIGTVTSAPLVFGTNNIERGRFGSNGRFGIATTTPAAMLAVQGNMFIAGNIISTSTLASIFPNATTTAVSVSGALFIPQTTALPLNDNASSVKVNTTSASTSLQFGAASLFATTSVSFTWSTSTPSGLATDTVPIVLGPRGQTFSSIACRAIGTGGATVRIGNGVASSSYIQAVPGVPAPTVLSSNNTFQAWQTLFLEIGGYQNTNITNVSCGMGREYSY